MKRAYGFTVVELLIVIVVIGIIAAISIVAYSNMQSSGRTSVLKSDLRQAKTYMDMKQVEEGSYPTTEAGLPRSAGTAYELASSSGYYCLSATAEGAQPYHVSSTSGLTSGPCAGHEFGGPAPAGVNIVAPLSQWVLSGGATLQGDSVSLPLYTSQSHRARSALMRVDGANTVTISFEARHSAGGETRHLWNSNYYAADKTTSVQNSTGHSSNGAAITVSSAGWSSHSFGFNLGPAVQYMRLEASTPQTAYPGPVEIRNVQVKLAR